MPTAGEMIERSGDGWEFVSYAVYKDGPITTYAVKKSAAIVAAAQWAEEREGKGA